MIHIQEARAEQLRDEATEALYKGQALYAIQKYMDASKLANITPSQKNNILAFVRKSLKEGRIEDLVMQAGLVGVNALELFTERGEDGRKYLDTEREKAAQKFFDAFAVPGISETEEDTLNLRCQILYDLRAHFYDNQVGSAS